MHWHDSEEALGMTFEHGNTRPDTVHEDWETQFDVLPWMAYLTAIPIDGGIDGC
jgi:hypothetical protein